MDNPTTHISPTDRRALRLSIWTRLLHALGIYLVLLGLVLVGALAFPGFATAANLINVLRSATLIGIVSIGVAFITYGGHYVDLSIPAIMATSGLVAISGLKWGLAAGLGCGLATGLAIGLVNGYVIGTLRLNPIIWTLAMAFLLDGLLRWLYGGNQIYPDAAAPAGAGFLALSQRELAGGLPAMTLLMLALAAAGGWVMQRTRFGTQVRLTGSAYEVARMSGVNVQRIVLLTFVISALTTTLAGLLLTSLNKQGTFDTGQGYDFNAVTAVVLGGVSLAGGRGSIAGALGGVLVIGVLLNLMSLRGLDSFTQMIVKGAVFITVVAMTTYFSRKSGRAER